MHNQLIANRPEPDYTGLQNAARSDNTCLQRHISHTSPAPKLCW